MKLSNEKGQGLVEYALVLVLVHIVVVAVLLLRGPIISGCFAEIRGGLGGTSFSNDFSWSMNKLFKVVFPGTTE